MLTGLHGPNHFHIVISTGIAGDDGTLGAKHLSRFSYLVCGQFFLRHRTPTRSDGDYSCKVEVPPVVSIEFVDNRVIDPNP